MKKFLLTALGGFLLAALTFAFYLYRLKTNHTDAYYGKISSPRQHSLILGTSRAAQGVIPSEMNRILREKNIMAPMYNFSFTFEHSPYGPSYLKAIRKKIEPGTSNGLFIVTVDPWSLSKQKTNTADNAGKFGENDLPPGSLRFINSSYNFEYLLTTYTDPWRKIIYNNDDRLYLHDDGWLEVSVDMSPKSVARRTVEKMDFYRDNYFVQYDSSSTRMRYLDSTIHFLQQHGTVYLVRLPVSQEMYDLEDKFWPNFNDRMIGLAGKYQIPYKDFTPAPDYVTTDGNHLFKEASRKVSAQLADIILSSGYQANK